MIQAVLAFLEVNTAPPTLDLLDALVAAYTRHVPWESASRIVRRAQTANDASCPRWPDEFWKLAMAQGSGGTCYESNYAFFALLLGLGFDGYLTINNMEDTIGCHSAIVIQLDEQSYLVDVGLPVHLPVPIAPADVAQRQSWYHRFTLTAEKENIYTLTRDLHPRPYCFTFINQPVIDPQYRLITVRDYGANGLFLDRVILVKVIGERIWRFSSDTTPYQMESFYQGERTFHFIGLSVEEASAALAAQFQVDEGTILAALRQTQSA